MDNVLAEVHLQEVALLAEYAEAFEVFCHRNCIPVEVVPNTECCTYRIRAGIDHTDALIMAYKQGWAEAGDPNVINLLVMDHNFRAPEYAYELGPCHRDAEDELVLSSHV